MAGADTRQGMIEPSLPSDQRQEPIDPGPPYNTDDINISQTPISLPVEKSVESYSAPPPFLARTPGYARRVMIEQVDEKNVSSSKCFFFFGRYPNPPGAGKAG